MRRWTAGRWAGASALPSYVKIDASSRAGAAMFAVQHGLLPDEKTAVTAIS